MEISSTILYFVFDKVQYIIMANIFKIKKRGRKGEGRAVKFKALMLPEEIIQELKLYKDHYCMVESTQDDEWGNPIPARVSFEQMLRHWMDNMDAIDPAAYEDVQSMMAHRAEHPSPETYDVDPFTYPIDKFKYQFETDDGEVDAVFNGETFVCSEDYLDYKGKTLDEMYNQNWPLSNDAGYEFSLEQAHELCRRMKKIFKKQGSKSE